MRRKSGEEFNSQDIANMLWVFQVTVMGSKLWDWVMGQLGGRSVTISGEFNLQALQTYCGDVRQWGGSWGSG
jgi:hypothetical protein